MALNTKKIPSTGNRVAQPELEPGVYPARVVQILDFGLQPQRPYKGQEKAPAYMISITYELVDVFMVDEDGNEIEDKPRWVSETFPIYSLDADKAKSTLRYKALDPQEVYEGDFSKLLDTPCNVSIVINKQGDKVYTNVANVAAMRPRDAAKCPELQNEPRFFDLDEPDLEVFNSLPDWIKEKISTNLEFKGSPLEELLANAPEKSEKEDKKSKPTRSRKAPAAEPEDENDPPFDADGEDDDNNPY